MEGGKDYYEMLDLGIGKCKFIVAGLREHNLFDKVGHVKIGTKYPNYRKQYSWKRAWMWSVSNRRLCGAGADSGLCR